VVDREHCEAFRKVLGSESPDAVFTHWPIDDHADHRAMSMLVYDAWLRMGRQFALYYYEVSNGEDTVQFAPRTTSISRPPSRGSGGLASRTPASRPRGFTPCRSE